MNEKPNMQVIARRVGGIPVGFPLDKWIEQDKVYTIKAVYKYQPQNTLGFILEEIDLTGEKYEAFQAARFDPFDSASEEEFEAAINECFDLEEISN